MLTRAFPLARVVGLALTVLCILLAGCGGASTHVSGAGAERQSLPSSAAQTSFLRKCSAGVGAGSLRDASLCQCTVTELEAETNARMFTADVAAWEHNTNGAGFRSTVAQTIARCSGEQEIGPSPESATAVGRRSVSPVRSVKLSKSRYAKRFRWPDSSQSMVHTCLDGAAVANGMSCQLAQAISTAFGEYPNSKTPVVRDLHLIDPDSGRMVSVDCAVSGREDASAVCNAPRHQVALLPPPHFSS